MRRLRRPWYGDGTVWLVVDQDKGDFLCCLPATRRFGLVSEL